MKGIDSLGKPFHRCSGNDDRTAMFKWIVDNYKGHQKNKDFIIHSSTEDKMVARHKIITDSLVAFIVDNIDVIWLYLSAFEKLSLDNFSTQFISMLIWFGNSLIIILFKVI